MLSKWGGGTTLRLPMLDNRQLPVIVCVAKYVTADKLGMY
jgi:hypothetical protein